MHTHTVRVGEEEWPVILLFIHFHVFVETKPEKQKSQNKKPLNYMFVL